MINFISELLLMVVIISKTQLRMFQRHTLLHTQDLFVKFCVIEGGRVSIALVKIDFFNFSININDNGQLQHQLQLSFSIQTRNTWNNLINH